MRNSAPGASRRPSAICKGLVTWYWLFTLTRSLNGSELFFLWHGTGLFRKQLSIVTGCSNWSNGCIGLWDEPRGLPSKALGGRTIFTPTRSIALSVSGLIAQPG